MVRTYAIFLLCKLGELPFINKTARFLFTGSPSSCPIQVFLPDHILHRHMLDLALQPRNNVQIDERPGLKPVFLIFLKFFQQFLKFRLGLPEDDRLNDFRRNLKISSSTRLRLPILAINR